ncbi:MAG: Rhodanese-like protein [Bacteroidota bacterium]|jgi:rhodanese-related sulfurtransferase|nr:Rhodanese-like protein [Bacteroidota bacterium]
MKNYFLIVFTLVVTATAYSQTSNSKVVTNLNAERFKAAAYSDKNAVILDLRTTEEIKSKGYIKGATQLDFLAKDAEKKIDLLDKKKTYYIYCAGGGRSGECAEYMEKKGFTRVFNLEKGFSEWQGKGFPVEK